MKKTMNYEAPVAEMIELQAVAGVMTVSGEQGGNNNSGGQGGNFPIPS